MPWWAWMLLALGWVVAGTVHLLARRAGGDEDVRSASVRLAPVARALILGASTLCVLSPLVPAIRGAAPEVIAFWLLAVVPAVSLIALGAFVLLAPSALRRHRRLGPSG